jgi:hypothetical protein
MTRFMKFEQFGRHGCDRNLSTIIQLFKVWKYWCWESKLSEDCLRSKHLKPKFFESRYYFSERRHHRFDFGNDLRIKSKIFENYKSSASRYWARSSTFIHTDWKLILTVYWFYLSMRGTFALNFAIASTPNIILSIENCFK